MECLQDYIGLNHCSILTTPESGLYLNDLPGIEIKNIDEIANSEQSDFVGVWEQIQKRAINRFKTDVINEFVKRYKLRQVQQSVNIGKQIEATTTTAAAVQWRGFTIELNRATEQMANSNMQVIAIQELYLYLTAAVNTTIKVFDIDTGVELYTAAVTGAIGWNTLKVGQKFTARRVFVCYDATTVISTKLDISTLQLNNTTINKGLFVQTTWDFCNSITRLKGANATKTTTVTSVTEGLDSFGLSGIFSIKCTFDSVVCTNKEHFAQALLFCLGSELMTERINSSRINRWTTVDMAKAKELKKYFEVVYKGGKYEDVDYDGELYTAVYGINLNKYDACIECDAPFRFMEAHL